MGYLDFKFEGDFNNMFIDHDYIEKILEDSKNVSKDEIQSVIDKARRREGLNHDL